MLAATLEMLKKIDSEVNIDLQRIRMTGGKDVAARQASISTSMNGKSPTKSGDDAIGFLIDMKRLHAANDYKTIFEDIRVMGFPDDPVSPQ
jgi:hypothetical protein